MAVGIVVLQIDIFADKISVWGGNPADLCTSNMWFGCERTGTAANPVNPIMSARVRTAETFSFKYGRVEIKAKMPKGDWIWPALWFLPVQEQYGLWPRSGEIDLIESRGNSMPGTGYGNDYVGTTLHWGPAWNADFFNKTMANVSLPDGQDFSQVSQNHPPVTVHLIHETQHVSRGVGAAVFSVSPSCAAVMVCVCVCVCYGGQDFHTFGLYWSKDEMYSYLDSPDNKIFSLEFASIPGGSFWEWGGFNGSWFNPWSQAPTSHAPYDQEFFIIMNVAVGGVSGFFPDTLPGKPWQVFPFVTVASRVDPCVA